MEPDFQQFVWLMYALLCGFTALSVLRVLAVFRENQIERYDIARKVKQMRYAYEHKNDDDDIVV